MHHAWLLTGRCGIGKATFPASLDCLRPRGMFVSYGNASGQIEGVLRRMAVCQVGDGAGAPVRCVVDSHVVGVSKPHSSREPNPHGRASSR